MPIIHIADNAAVKFPEGAFCDLFAYRVNHKPQVFYETDRGWCYVVSPEARAEYKARFEYGERRKRVMDKRKRRLYVRALAEEVGLTTEQMVRVMNCYDKNTLDRVLTLMRSRRLRSHFKSGLQQQLMDWARDPNPRYHTPLSIRQLNYV